MCGIAGFFSSERSRNSAAGEILPALRSRGPDAEHVVAWDARFRSVEANRACHHALIHTRLSIIDPRPVADQPMANASHDIWICYNGEVYGWEDHARALAREGVHFRTRSDTEYILAIYEREGIDCLARLRGMFALAILDIRKRVLWLARDRMGLKPVLYAHNDKTGFAFGSTVRSVLPMLEASERGFDPSALDAFLAHRYIPAPLTVMTGIRRLPNAHTLKYDLTRNSIEVRPYWTLQPQSQGDWLTVLDDAVQLRTVADRPVGLFLSGGLDSSVVASRLSASARNKVASFTAAFPGSHFDESEEAKAIAATLGIANTAVPVAMSVRDDFDKIVSALDEPFADPSSIPTWYLARETARSVKVVLSGDGGDELFAGYKRVDKHLRTAWRRGLRFPALPIVPTVEARGRAKWLTELALDWQSAYALRFSGFSPGQRRFLTGDAPLTRAVYWRRDDDECAATKLKETPVAQLLKIDCLNYLPEYILRKADLCTMAHGLELRAPLLDHVWVQTILALPEAERFTRPRKRLLARAMPALSGLDLLTRKKRGFNPPLGAWLKTDLAERMPELHTRLTDLTSGWLSPQRVRSFVERYRAGSDHLGEQMLQLLILDESLGQLTALKPS